MKQEFYLKIMFLWKVHACKNDPLQIKLQKPLFLVFFRVKIWAQPLQNRKI